MKAVVMLAFAAIVEIQSNIVSHFGSFSRQQSSAPQIFLWVHLSVLVLHDVGFVPDGAVASSGGTPWLMAHVTKLSFAGTRDVVAAGSQFDERLAAKASCPTFSFGWIAEGDTLRFRFS